MRNNYEASEMLELGTAHEEVLGTKPVINQIDSLLGAFRQQVALPDDIDESE